MGCIPDGLQVTHFDLLHPLAVLTQLILVNFREFTVARNHPGKALRHGLTWLFSNIKHKLLPMYEISFELHGHLSGAEFKGP